MSLAIQIAALVSLFLVLLGGGLFLFFRWLRRRATAVGEAWIIERFTASEIVLQELYAHGLGHKSKGALQVRGNGALVLTDSALCFRQAVGQSEFCIERSAIQRVDLVDSHLGRRFFGRKLLWIRYQRADSSEDEFAWLTADPQRWLQTLNEPRS